MNNKTKGSIQIGLIVLLIVAAAGVWYLAWDGMQETKTPTPEVSPTPAESPTPTTTESTTESEIDTSDWQTYRNEEYGFEIRYPMEFEFVTSTDAEYQLAGMLKTSVYKNNITITLKPLEGYEFIHPLCDLERDKDCFRYYYDSATKKMMLVISGEEKVYPTPEYEGFLLGGDSGWVGYELCVGDHGFIDCKYVVPMENQDVMLVVSDGAKLEGERPPPTRRIVETLTLF